MRTLPVPTFQAAPEEPIVCTFEPHPTLGVFPGEVLHRVPAGRKAVSLRVEYYYRQLKTLPRRVRRALTRRYARSLAGVALLLALGQAPALAATITVAGSCSVVDAITAANTDTATGGCSAGSGADVVTLTGDVTLTAVDNTTDGPNGLPSVTSPVTLNGNGRTLERSTVTDTPDFRLLHVADTGNLTINRITMANGRAGSYGGGAVYNRGTVALNASTVAGNEASSGGGVVNGGTLTLADSTVSGNAAQIGGGVGNFGTLTLTNSTVSGNTAADIYGGFGGGVDNGGTLTVTHSTISGNTADLGGGVSNFNTLAISDSTVSGNSAQFGGGVSHGLVDCDDGDAGQSATLTNSTISGNSAISGGGLGVAGDSDDCGTVTLTHSTVSGNTASERVAA